MTTTWRHLPAPAREIAAAATDAVAAATARQGEAYGVAADRLT
jgi:hypothetical protein